MTRKKQKPGKFGFLGAVAVGAAATAAFLLATQPQWASDPWTRLLVAVAAVSITLVWVGDLTVGRTAHARAVTLYMVLVTLILYVPFALTHHR